MSTTQLYRPSLEEASSEAFLPPDSHWTASLSSSGTTRIARTVVASLGDEDPGAGFLYESFWA